MKSQILYALRRSNLPPPLKWPIDFYTGGTDNMVYRYIDMLPSVLSIYSLSLVALDRAFVIAMPYYHRRYEFHCQ